MKVFWVHIAWKGQTNYEESENLGLETLGSILRITFIMKKSISIEIFSFRKGKIIFSRIFSNIWKNSRKCDKKSFFWNIPLFLIFCLSFIIATNKNLINLNLGQLTSKWQIILQVEFLLEIWMTFELLLVYDKMKIIFFL